VTTKILVGDCRAKLKQLPADSIHCVITSPPYYGLRDYGTATWSGGKAKCDHKPSVNTRTAIRKSGLTQKRAVLKDGVRDLKSNAYMGNATSAHYKDKCGKCGAVRTDDQIGLEASYQDYVAALVEVSREIRRVLRPDGVYWLNLGDSYSTNMTTGNNEPAGSGSGKTSLELGGKHLKVRMKNMAQSDKSTLNKGRGAGPKYSEERLVARNTVPDTMRGDVGLPHHGPNRVLQPGLKHKDLMGIPWRVALALQDDGWYLRMDVIWHKPQPMPESVIDRPTKSHEYVFMLTKLPHYYFDGFAVREASADSWNSKKSFGTLRKKADHLSEEGMDRQRTQFAHNTYHDDLEKTGRNKRSVWTIGTPQFGEAHFATFPEELVEVCVKSSASEKGCCAKCGRPWVREIEKGESASGLAGTFELRTAGWKAACKCKAAGEPVPCTILDPFGGAGTVGLVASKLGHDAVLVELSVAYAKMAARRIKRNMGFFGKVEIE
jgi:DNA modification methylase